MYKTNNVRANKQEATEVSLLPEALNYVIIPCQTAFKLRAFGAPMSRLAYRSSRRNHYRMWEF